MVIKKCRACNSKDLQLILSLGNQYLSDFIEMDDPSKPPSYPLDLVLCAQCALLQLKEHAPQSSLYTEHYGYKSGINATMNQELAEIAKKAKKLIPQAIEKPLVVDIGANDGTLLKNYPQSFIRVGVEPIKKLAKECKKNADFVVNDFFSYKAFNKKMGKKKADIVTAISCFYDMEEPNTFLEDVTNILKDEGVFIIQQNYLVEMLRLVAFDNIVHEHLEYYSLLSLENLLARHNLEVFDVELSDINGGSFRTYIAFKGKKEISQAVLSMRKKEDKLKLLEPDIYHKFASKVKSNSLKLHNFIKKAVKKGQKVYVYGASTRGNTLLQYAQLDNSLIAAAAERNTEKWGKKIASVGIPIISEEQARKEKPDYMLVLPWFFKDEFLKREKKYLESGGHFIFPLPKFHVE